MDEARLQTAQWRSQREARHQAQLNEAAGSLAAERAKELTEQNMLVIGKQLQAVKQSERKYEAQLAHARNEAASLERKLAEQQLVVESQRQAKQHEAQHDLMEEQKRLHEQMKRLAEENTKCVRFSCDPADAASAPTAVVDKHARVRVKVRKSTMQPYPQSRRASTVPQVFHDASASDFT